MIRYNIRTKIRDLGTTTSRTKKAIRALLHFCINIPSIDAYMIESYRIFSDCSGTASQPAVQATYTMA